MVHLVRSELDTDWRFEGDASNTQTKKCVMKVFVFPPYFSLINDKSLADCVEALIGCFLLKTGSFGALKFMSKIGLDMSSSNTVDDLLARKISNERVEIFNPPRHGFSEDDVGDAEMQRAELLYQKLGVSEIENIIDYKFREKSFLLQAFTHASYCDNRVTGSYERLEYLGDGVLDYLVTVYIYTKLGQVMFMTFLRRLTSFVHFPGQGSWKNH